MTELAQRLTQADRPKEFIQRQAFVLIVGGNSPRADHQSLSVDDAQARVLIGTAFLYALSGLSLLPRDQILGWHPQRIGR
ncbi:MAG: hypothetical protein ACTHN7_09075 [Solirubrobacterales bacterium]